MELLFWIVLGFSVLCLLYYILIVIYNGPRTAFCGFWIFACLTGVFLCTILRHFILHKIEVVPLLRMVFNALMVLGWGSLFGMEAIIISHAKQKAGQGMDYMVILGAQVRGTTITRSLLRRLDTAVIYLKNNPKTVVIVSGGRGEMEAVTEAEAMKQYLMQQGISENRIIKEDESRNTYENFRYSKAFIQPGSTIVIVTNGFHMLRSMRLAKRLGLNAQGISAPTDAILAVNYYVREAVGIMKDKLLGNI